MQSTTTQSVISFDNTNAGQLTAQRLDDTLAWGQGSIRPQADYATPEDEKNLLEAVLACIEPVAKDEATYTACTDGRCPVRLLSDEQVPVREQLVGADIVSAFYVAENLCESFYRDANAPVADRVKEVAEFLQTNGFKPSTHLGCGAAAGFTIITDNVIKFSEDPAYLARVQALLPEGVFNKSLHQNMMQANRVRLDDGAYDGLTADTFVDAVEAVSGKHAIAELKDDGRGVHGHVEEAIIRLRTPGFALNTAKLAGQTGGREVFAVNDNRMDALAKLFGRGQDTDYQIARMSLEDFASTGHGTLAKDLPTFVVTK
ncbi:MAG TPA: hypothetical protein VFB59_00710 [Candidatus Saccharimonadales bacterium]|nr:hypothetical protein [Candidatus Saccharimonadales bacterium]